VELGYKLAKEYWNQGLTTEAAQAVQAWAFEHLDIERLISIIDPANMASLRVAEKNDMTYAQDVEYDGKTCHVYTIQRRPS
jgi:ribosomal-protein-alanine N-acetyltransferase